MRLLKPLLAAAAIAAVTVPTLASAEPYWAGGGPDYSTYRDYHPGWRSERAEAMRIHFLREREFAHTQAFERARWEWRIHHDRDYGYWNGYRGW